MWPREREVWGPLLELLPPRPHPPGEEDEDEEEDDEAYRCQCVLR